MKSNEKILTYHINYRKVSSAEGMELADAFMIPYIETSAKRHSADAISKF